MTDSVLIVFLINCIDCKGLYTSLTEVLTGLASIFFLLQHQKRKQEKTGLSRENEGVFLHFSGEFRHLQSKF